MLTPASASGTAREAITPVSARSSGPRTANVRHGPSQTVPAGTDSTAQTADNSVGVRVIETKPPCCTQAGSASLGGHRQMAQSPGIRSRSRAITDLIVAVNAQMIHHFRHVDGYRRDVPRGQCIVVRPPRSEPALPQSPGVRHATNEGFAPWERSPRPRSAGVARQRSEMRVHRATRHFRYGAVYEVGYE
jgi:hypothetical protein